MARANRVPLLPALAVGLVGLVGLGVGMNIQIPDVDRDSCEFGSVVAADGEYVIVGAEGNSANVTYIYHVEEENGKLDILSVGLHDDKYFNDVVFTRVNDYQSYLFGKSVDIMGDTAVVGAPGSFVFDDGYYETTDDENGTAQNVPNHNSVQNAGMVFVYERNTDFDKTDPTTGPMFRGKFYMTKGNYNGLSKNQRFGNIVKLFNERILIVGTLLGELLVYDIGDENVSMLENNRFIYDKIISDDDGIERNPYLTPIGTLECPDGELCGSFGKDRIQVMGDYLLVGDSGYKVSAEKKVGGIFVFRFVENYEEKDGTLFTGFKYQHVIVNDLANSSGSNFGKDFVIQSTENGYDLVVSAPGTSLFMGSEPDAGMICYIELDKAFKPISAYSRSVTGKYSGETVKYIVNVVPDIIYPPYPTKGDGFGEIISMTSYNGHTLVAVSSSKKKLLDTRKGLVSLYKLVDNNTVGGKNPSKRFELIYTLSENSGYKENVNSDNPEFLETINGVNYASSMTLMNGFLVVGATSFSYNVPDPDAKNIQTNASNEEEEESPVIYKTIKNGAVYIYSLFELLDNVKIPELLLPVKYYEKSMYYEAYLLFKNYKDEYFGTNDLEQMNPPLLSLQCGTTSYKPPTLLFTSEMKASTSISVGSSQEGNVKESTAYVYNISINGIQGMVCSFEISGIAFESSSYYDSTMYVGDSIHSQTVEISEFGQENLFESDDSSAENILVSSSSSNNINNILMSRFTENSYILQYSLVDPLDSISVEFDPNNLKDAVNISADYTYVDPIPLYYKQLSIVFTVNSQSESKNVEKMAKQYSIYSLVLPNTNTESKYVVYNKQEEKNPVSHTVSTFDYINIKMTGSSYDHEEEDPDYDPGDVNLDTGVAVNNQIISNYSFGSVIANDGSAYVIGTDTKKESLLLVNITESTQEYKCDIMNGIRQYEKDQENTSYGVNGTNNIQVLEDKKIIIVGAPSVDAVYFVDFECNVKNKITRPKETASYKQLFDYNLNTEEEEEYLDTLLYPSLNVLDSFGASVKLVPTSEILDDSEVEDSDYIMFVGAPNDIHIDIRNIVGDISNLHLNISEILNIVCLGDVYMLSISIQTDSTGNSDIVYNDENSSAIRKIPCNTKHGDLSFGDKVEVSYRSLMISSSMKVNKNSTDGSDENTIPVTIGSTTYYIPVADGAVELFVIDDLTLDNKATKSSQLTHVSNLNMYTSFKLRNDFALFGKETELITMREPNETKGRKRFLLYISSRAATISYHGQGAVVQCKAIIEDKNLYNEDDDDIKTLGTIKYTKGNYVMIFGCDSMMISGEKCAGCNYGSSLKKTCYEYDDKSDKTCILVVGENKNNTYASNANAGAVHYYEITINTDASPVKYLGTKISTYDSEDEKFGTALGVGTYVSKDKQHKIISVIGSPGTTTSFGFNSGLVTVIRDVNTDYVVNVVGMNNRDIESGSINNMATVWEGAVYNMYIASTDIFGNLSSAENIEYSIQCIDMMTSGKNENSYNLKGELKHVKNSDRKAYSQYTYEITGYSGGMCKFSILNSDKTPTYSMYLFPDASNSTLKVADKTTQYTSVPEIYSALIGSSTDDKTIDAGLVMDLCLIDYKGEYITSGIDYNLIQFNTNCVLSSGKIFSPVFAGMSGKCYRFASELPFLNKDVCSVRAYSHYYSLDAVLDIEVPDLSTLDIVLIVLAVIALAMLATWVGIVIGCEGKPASEILSCARCCYADYEEVDDSDNSDFGESMIPSDTSSGPVSN